MPRWVVELNTEPNTLPKELREAATIRNQDGKDVWEYLDRFNALKAAHFFGTKAILKTHDIVRS